MIVGQCFNARRQYKPDPNPVGIVIDEGTHERPGTGKPFPYNGRTETKVFCVKKITATGLIRCEAYRVRIRQNELHDTPAAVMLGPKGITKVTFKADNKVEGGYRDTAAKKKAGPSNWEFLSTVEYI